MEKQLTISDIAQWVETFQIVSPVFAYNFTTKAPDESATVELGATTRQLGKVRILPLILVVRSKRAIVAEEKILQFQTAFESLRNASIGDSTITKLNARQAIPFYLGEDNNERKYFRCEFTLFLSLNN